MAVSQQAETFHREQAKVAKERFLESLSLEEQSKDWQDTKAKARAMVEATLAATANLTDIASALQVSGQHLFVLRRLLAPPMAQDQFEHLSDAYSKSRENKSTPVPANKAVPLAEKILEWRDRKLTRWLDEKREPSPSEIQMLVDTGALLITAQSAATVRRNLLADKQENTVIDRLKSLGWEQKRAPLITESAQLPALHFMHKTRFATKTASQEVDIACGLGKSVVLAMECKVTNDATNSVKRVNDVLKKAKAWQDHWGHFVRTATLLQGVIAYKDVHRLLDDNVEVFWTHRLEDLNAWLAVNTRTS